MTQPFAKILVGVDGSERAGEAARQGARLAAAMGSAVEFAYVVDPRHPHDGDVEALAESALSAAASVAAALGTTADTRLLTGDPAETLVAEAAEEDVDLLCIGPDAGLLGGALRIGQVAGHVLREARCPVLVARPAGEAFPADVLCGVDGSDASTQTAGFAAAIASTTRARLRLLHVIPTFRGGDDEWTLEPAEATPPELEASVRAAADLGVEAIREMAMGRPEHAIVAVAEREACDLLVVGHRGVKGIRKALLGSVSEYCATHARCSVLVARAG